MSKEQTSLGPWLYWSLMVTATLSYGFLNLPYYAIQKMGNNAYLAIPIGALLSLPGLLAIYQLMKRFPGSNLIEVTLRLFSALPGRILSLFYLLALLIILATFTRDTINLVSIYLMEDTPLLILTVTYLFTAAYLSSRGIETISRLASFVILPTLVVILSLIFGMLSEIKINHLLPVFHPALNQYLPGGASVVNGFYPLAFFALITPYLRGIRKKIPELTLWGGLILIFLYILFIIGPLGIFGHDYLGRFAYPGLDAIHAMEFPYLVIEQAGLLLIIAWITIVIVGSSFLYYVLAVGLSQVAGVLDYKGLVWLLIPLKLYLIMLPKNVGETKELFQYIADYGWIPLFGLPILLFLYAVVFKKGEDLT